MSAVSCAGLRQLVTVRTVTGLLVNVVTGDGTSGMSPKPVLLRPGSVWSLPVLSMGLCLFPGCASGGGQGEAVWGIGRGVCAQAGSGYAVQHPALPGGQPRWGGL